MTDSEKDYPIDDDYIRMSEKDLRIIILRSCNHIADLGKQLADREKTIESLQSDMKFMGASYNKEGNLEINMSRYHKAHCENCDKGENCLNKLLREENEKLREGLKKYGKHSSICTSWYSNPIDGKKYSCSCYLAALIGE